MVANSQCFISGAFRNKNGRIVQSSNWQKYEGNFLLSDFSNHIFIKNGLTFIQHGSKLIECNNITISNASSNWTTLCIIEDNSDTMRVIPLNTNLSAESVLSSQSIIPGKWKKVAATESYIYALSNEQDVYSLSVDNNYSIPPQLFSSFKVKQIACGNDHVIVLSIIGQIYSAGIGSRGQLGHGDLEESRTLQCIEALCPITVVEIAAGNWHSLCLSDSGDVYSWGWNSFGQLGVPAPRENIHLIDEEQQQQPPEEEEDWHSTLSPATVHAVPVVVEFPDGESEDQLEVIDGICCGGRHSVCWSSSNRRLYTFGWNGYGQLGGDVSVSWSDRPLLVSSDCWSMVLRVQCGHWSTVITIDD